MPTGTDKKAPIVCSFYPNRKGATSWENSETITTLPYPNTTEKTGPNPTSQQRLGREPGLPPPPGCNRHLGWCQKRLCRELGLSSLQTVMTSICSVRGNQVGSQMRSHYHPGVKKPPSQLWYQWSHAESSHKALLLLPARVVSGEALLGTRTPNPCPAVTRNPFPPQVSMKTEWGTWTSTYTWQ